jgi:hypothetical protein
MRIIHAVAVAGALVLGAATAQAQSAGQPVYGQTQAQAQTQYPVSTLYSSAYGQQVVPPEVAFDPNATLGGTTVNASAVDGGQVLYVGRAATAGAAPLGR